MSAIARGRQRVRQFLEWERDIAAMVYRASRGLRIYSPVDRDRLRRDLLNEELDEVYSQQNHCPEEDAHARCPRGS
jgi:hypothetical protein